MRVIYWIISIPLAVLITIFAVSNRALVTLSFWPLPFEIDLPLFLPLLLALVLGLVIGVAFEWLREGRNRRALRRSENELSRVRKAQDQIQKDAERDAVTNSKAVSSPASGSGATGTPPTSDDAASSDPHSRQSA